MKNKIPYGVIGYFGDYPAHRNWVVRLIWRIKKRLGILKRTGIPVVVMDKLPKNPYLCHIYGRNKYERKNN